MAKVPYMPDWEARDRFLAEYCKDGKIKSSAAAAGVLYETALTWSKQEWFKERVAEFRRRYNHQMTLKIRGLLDKAFDHIDDRLTHGELKLVKKVVDGEEVRIEERHPIAVKDLTILSSVLFDKYHTVTKTEAPEASDAQKALDNIASKLRKFNKTGNANDLKEVTTIEADDLC